MGYLDRIKQIIDARFNRARYSAALVLEDFAHRVREEVDLPTLAHDLLAAVSAAMAPSSISLWLQEASSAPTHPSGYEGSAAPSTRQSPAA